MTLKDTKTVVKKIERIIYAFLHIVFIFFYLLIFNVSQPGLSHPHSYRGLVC